MDRITKSAILLVAIITSFSSCIKNDLEPYTDDPIELYKRNFKAYIGGDVNSNQVWGFGTSSTARTRAAEEARVSVNKDEYSTTFSKAYFETVQSYFPEGKACTDSKYRNYEFNENAPHCFVDLIYTGTSSDDVIGIYYYDPATETAKDAKKIPMIEDLKSNINYYMQYSKYDTGSNWGDADIEIIDGYKLWNEYGVKRIRTRAFTIWMNGSYRFGFYVYNKDTGKTYYSNKYLNDNEAELGGLIGYENVGNIIDNYVFGLSDDDQPGCEILLSIPKTGDGGLYPTPVSPVKPEPKPEPLEWHRIIAEDLNVHDIYKDGSKDDTDFDFNDIVLDVALTKTGGASCILQAAGATLQIRINGDDKLEVHKLFGVAQNVMVNTDAEKHDMTGAKKDPVKFELTGPFSSIKDIKIEVFRDNRWIELTAPKGDAASKIAVDTDFEWPYERQSLKEKYPDFPKYAKDDDIEKWWKKF